MANSLTDPRSPLRIGLTGGIASGKTTVARLFAALGTEVIDADEIAHELTAPGSPLLDAIAASFGAGLIDGNGELDRRRLAAIVFRSAHRREELEAILHPPIFAELEARARRASGSYALLVIPLLAETGAVALLDRILVVDCRPSEQLARLMAREDMSEALARRILAAQASREARLRLADDVLLNEVPREALPGLVRQLDRLYRSLNSPEEARARPGLRLP